MAMVGEQDAVSLPSDHTQAPKKIFMVGMEEGASVSPSSLATPALSTIWGQHCLSKNKDTPTKLIWKDLREHTVRWGKKQNTELHVEYMLFYVREERKLK